MGIITNNSVFKNIAGSIALKFISAIVSFLVIPMILNLLGKENYAIWVTATSLLAWIALFDFGVGYSLKNKVSEYLVLKEWNKLYDTIAATIQFLLLLIIILFICFLGAFMFVDIFKDQPILIIILYIPFILSFPLISGGFILQGHGKFNLLNVLQLCQPILWFLFIFCAYKDFFKIDLFIFAIVYSTSTLLIRVVTIIIALKSIHFPMHILCDYKLLSNSKNIIMSGIHFFLLQIVSLILYSMGNILAYEHLNLDQVAMYDVINKLFLFGMTAFNIIIAVFWTEVSKAKALINVKKLKKIHHCIYLVALLFSVTCSGMMFICPYFIPFWTKGLITVSAIQIAPFVILVTIQSFGYAGAVFLNAFEKLRGQIVLGIFSALLMIPMAKFLFNMNLGITAIPLSSTILTIPAVIYCFWESKKCIKRL
jgi:O-antigen/teichoic acid export membrane protein